MQENKDDKKNLKDNELTDSDKENIKDVLMEEQSKIIREVQGDINQENNIKTE